MMPENSPASLNALAAACEGLLFPSETDEPITPLMWSQPTGGSLTPATLLIHESLPPDTAVKCVEFDAFFDHYLPSRAGSTDTEQRARLTRLQLLRAALVASLSDLRVYRVGQINLGIYILGITDAGETAGVQTRAVET